MNLKDLKSSAPEALITLSEELQLKHLGIQQKPDLIVSILRHYSEQGQSLSAEGVLEILPDGFGYLRSAEAHFLPSADDIYVSRALIKEHQLKTGDTLEGYLVPIQETEQYFALERVTQINYEPPSKTQTRIHFDTLTPLFPTDLLKLDSKHKQSASSVTTERVEKVSSRSKRLNRYRSDQDITTRLIDLVAPLGKGQRALIVAPPRTGKTVMLQSIANMIAQEHPEIHLIVLLIDERPEEVTDMKRSVKGEVVASTFDEPPSRHVQVAEMVIEKAKRLVECQRDVVILLDSITRLGRAYNTIAPNSGKILSGGVDAGALQKPKRFFGAARNIEQGGSLTIIGTALVDTGSRMDEVIFEEFKGTGNAEIVLDRKLAERRIFPCLDIAKSGTRKEDLLVSPEKLSKMWVLRRVLMPMGSSDAMEFLLPRLKESEDNSSFFEKMNR